MSSCPENYGNKEILLKITSVIYSAILRVSMGKMHLDCHPAGIYAVACNSCIDKCKDLFEMTDGRIFTIAHR
jgi:hypothetical protein